MSSNTESTTLVSPKLTPGNVLSYIPKDYHCRQGTAIVLEDGRGAVDTFWDEFGKDSNCHWLTGKELETAEVKFNVNDYEQIGTYGHCAPSDEAEWARYRPEDRAHIGSQSQWCAVLLVRKGSKPDTETIIENARREVELAEGDVESANRKLGWARENLAKLEAERDV